MDGVLSDASKRQHFLEGPMRRWDEFFSACGEDSVIPEAVELTRLVDPSVAIVLLTARPMRVQPQTLDWVRRQGFRWDLLVMRGDASWASSHAFKHQELLALQREGLDVRLAIDDDPRNVDMFRNAGVPALYFHSGYYD
jgi:hypothetical protein